MNKMKLVTVPAGEFLMGSDEGCAVSFSDEEPQCQVYVAGFHIGKYPVTNAEYAAFKPAHKYPAEQENHPVVGVSWFDACAYCAWLTTEWRRLGAIAAGQVVRLPTEAEWEKAARGTDARTYPWGDKFDKRKCNTREAGIGRTTPVGKYSPVGDSPYGCADTVGNVWEWCRSKYMPYPYAPDGGREELNKGSDVRVLRGGAWYLVSDFARCASRDALYPYYRGYDLGFRLVLVSSPLS